MPWSAILALAIGTYVFRIIGPLFRGRVHIPARVEQLLSDASVVVLVALVANSSLTSDGDFSGLSRVVGVVVGGMLALINLPAVRKLIARRFAPGRRHRRPAGQDQPGHDESGHDESSRSMSPSGRRSRRPVHVPFPAIILAAAVIAALLRMAGLR